MVVGLTNLVSTCVHNMLTQLQSESVAEYLIVYLNVGAAFKCVTYYRFVICF